MSAHRTSELARPHTKPDEIDFAVRVAHGADELARAELEPLDAAERRAIGDLVLHARLMSERDLSRGDALRLMVSLTRRVALGVSHRRLCPGEIA